MALYLQMDGVDDNLKTPSVTFNEIVMDVTPRFIKYADTLDHDQYFLDSRVGIANSYIFYRSSTSKVATSGSSPFANGIYIDGVRATDVYNIPLTANKRSLVRLVFNTTGTDDVTFLSNNTNGARTAGDVYDIKLYNSGVLVAHYDMSTGTVQDQSGNGRHATLTGGTWLDDGTGGGDTGTDGVTAFDSRQSIYETALTQADTKQLAYADSTISTDLRHLLYADQSQAADTRIAIYQDGDTTQDTAQILYEMSSAAFDTLQEVFNDGQVGATPFDVRVQLYGDASAQYDTKQAVYDGGLLRYDVAQVIYESNTAVADVKAVIYADSAIKADAMQSIYADGTFDADTLQRILAEFSEYSEVVRIVLEITERRRDPLSIVQSHSDTLEIVQRKTIELNL